MSGKQTLPLQHVFAGERLQGFSDAVFAIIATFMVVPLTVHISAQNEVEGPSLASRLVQSDLLIKYSLYFFSFGMVLDTWFTHVAIFSIIEQVDDVILNLNLLVLLFVSFLPFTCILLVSSYGQDADASIERISIALCLGDIAITGFVMATILLYAFWKQKLIYPEISNNSEIRVIQRSSVISVMIKPLLAILTLVVTLVAKKNFVSFILFYTVGGVTLIIRIAFYIYFRKVKKTIDRLPRHIFKTVASKFRIEFFSDGIFSIVATLLVLDITTQAGTMIDDNSFSNTIVRHPYIITSYLINFTIVGFLWLIHYQMFHFIKKFTPLLVIINLGIIFLVGLIPFASKIDAKYSSEEYQNTATKNTAVQLMCCIVFFIGLLETIFWVVALFQKRKCMSSEVEHFNSESLQFCKTIVIPILSLIVYFGSLLDGFVANHTDIACFLSTPFIYLFLDGLFYCYGKIRQKMMLKAVTRKILKEKMTEIHGTDSMRTDITDHTYSSYRSSLKRKDSSRPRSQALKVQIFDVNTSYGYSQEASLDYETEGSNTVLSKEQVPWQ